MAASSAELGMCWAAPPVPNARCNLKNVGALVRTFLCTPFADFRLIFAQLEPTFSFDKQIHAFASFFLEI